MKGCGRVMIKTKTLFILGAGASNSFRYPTSQELRNEIIEGKYIHEVAKAFSIHVAGISDRGMYDNEIRKFVEAYKKSGVYSIDAFIEKRQEYMAFGKMIITASLLRRENIISLTKTEENWYMYLFNRIKDTIVEQPESVISFITFNYDRSLEQFLFNAIKEYNNLQPPDCIKVLKKIPIAHLYGQINYLPWQQQENTFTYLNDSKSYVARLIDSLKNIKLIGEEREIEESEVFQEAYKLIEKAKKIYFLGFGYDETNLDRLRIENMRGKNIVGSVLDVEKSKLNFINKYFSSKGAPIQTVPGTALATLSDTLDYE